MARPNTETVFDAIVIGTGFAGAVTACRLVEGGQHSACSSVAAATGRRFSDNIRPTNSLPTTRTLPEQFAPPSRFFALALARRSGLYDLRISDDAIPFRRRVWRRLVIYASVHLRPPREVFEHGWPLVTRNGKLDPFFDLAAYMLQVTTVPKHLNKTAQLEATRTSAPPQTGFWHHWPLISTKPGGTASAGSRTPVTCARSAGAAAIARQRTRSTSTTWRTQKTGARNSAERRRTSGRSRK